MFKIISGGQTGADRAGIMAASNMSIATGGHAPQNYMTEKGPSPDLAGLGLVETPHETGVSPKDRVADNYRSRTALNVEEADCTILFGRPSPGYNLTKRWCQNKAGPKPLLEISFTGKSTKVNPNRAAEKIYEWITSHGFRTINIAGNRESKNPGIYEYVFQVMIQVCQKLKEYEGRGGR